MSPETTDPPMDHREVFEQQLIDRYLLGQLPTEEARRFEVHYLSCSRCMEQLELTETLLHGLRRAAAQDAAVVRGGWLAALLRRRWVAPVLAMALLLVHSGWLYQRLQQQTTALHTVESELERVQIPQVGSIYLPLNPLRGAGNDAPSHHLRLPPSPGWLVLALELDPPLASTYRVVLLDVDEKELWQSGDFVPNSFDALMLSLPSTFLEPGDYLLRAIPSSGPAVRFTLRVLASK